MMSVLARRASAGRSSRGMGFAAKMIGIGLAAGVVLAYCQFLIDACFRGIH
jgi:hypothetical protein